MVDEDFDEEMFDEDDALALEEGLEDSVDLIDDELADEPVSDVDVDDVEELVDEVDPDEDVSADADTAAFADQFDESGVVLPPTATFDVDAVEAADDDDDDDDDRPPRSMIEVDDEDDEDDTVREGEFVCRSCFMAKRESALADEDRLLCLDCV